MSNCLENCQNCINYAFLCAKKTLNSNQKAALEQIFFAHKICKTDSTVEEAIESFLERIKIVKNEKAFWNIYGLHNCFYAISYFYLKRDEKKSSKAIICALCDNDIVKIDKRWEHVDKNLRHIARPRE